MFPVERQTNKEIANQILLVAVDSHFNAHLSWDLRPQSGVLNRCNWFLRIPIYVHVEHQPTKSRP